MDQQKALSNLAKEKEAKGVDEAAAKAAMSKLVSSASTNSSSTTPAPKVIKLKKDDVDYCIKELELSKDDSEKLLKENDGNLITSIRAFFSK